MLYSLVLPQLYDLVQVTWAITLALAAFLTLFYGIQWLNSSPFRLVNGKKFGELTDTRAKREFMSNAQQLIAKGLDLAPGHPFRILGDVGEMLILPPKYAYEIRNHKQLSFTMAVFKVKTRQNNTVLDYFSPMQ